MRKTKMVSGKLPSQQEKVEDDSGNNTVDDKYHRYPARQLMPASPEYCLRDAQDDARVEHGHLSKDTTSGLIKKRKTTRQLFPTTQPQGHTGTTTFTASTGQGFQPHVKCCTASEKLYDDGRNLVPDIAYDDYELEGYASDTDKMTLYTSPQTDEGDFTGEAFLFEKASNKMIIRLGHQFKDVFQFRRAVEVFAIRGGFKLCIMENRSDFVSCECSALCCDWKITASADSSGHRFTVTEFVNAHKCNRSITEFYPTSKWIAAMFLHTWKQQPNIQPYVIQKQIASKYNVSCHISKLHEASKRAKALLDIDHTDGYLDIYQYIDEMKKLHTRNTVILETDNNEVVGDATFKRLFVCFAEPAYAFKYECRRMLFVDGWKLKGPYESVMLVAAAIDGNDGILPISFCEVLNEDIDSWVFFLTNLTKALNMEHGEGLCILTDGENGLDYVCEEYLCRGEIRQCCRNIFTKLVKTFPDAPVQHLFWAACRSASSYKFDKYMKLITDESEECHAWLMGTNWNQWALHCMPNWVKSNHVTLMVTEQLHRFMKRYLHLSITHRFTGLTNATAYLFEHRRIQGWEWLRQRITPTVTKIIQHHLIESRNLAVQNDNGRITCVTDSVSTLYEVDMQRKLCSCGFWQKSGVPCPHTCKCIVQQEENIDDFVHNMRTISQYRDTYGPGMNTLPKEFPWMSQVSTVLLLPPCAHATILEDTPDRIPHTKQVKFPCFL